MSLVGGVTGGKNMMVYSSPSRHPQLLSVPLLLPLPTIASICLRAALTITSEHHDCHHHTRRRFQIQSSLHFQHHHFTALPVPAFSSYSFFFFPQSETLLFYQVLSFSLAFHFSPNSSSIHFSLSSKIITLSLIDFISS